MTTPATRHVRYGIWDDTLERFVEDAGTDSDEAQQHRHRYIAATGADPDDVHVDFMCATHDLQPRYDCPECAADEEQAAHALERRYRR